MEPLDVRPDEVLERLFQRYKRAVARGTAAAADLAVVDELLIARVALYEHLVREGWDPPADVRQQLATDQLLLEVPPTAVPG